ncbi:hypothetical protein [Luteimonas abyssi]|uniref:hypothetical protein n=1 Tax=Luteimonas abyssi TaxID=1247514 RepID=UPI000737C0A1|nr:hypothetical protein [Luteimonas abyssi]
MRHLSRILRPPVARIGITPLAALFTAALALAGCRPADPTPPEPPPTPQTGGLGDAVRDPLDKAQAVEQAVEDADARRRETLDDG